MKRFSVFLFALAALIPGLVAQNPEPSGWYAGDMHVHRSCGGSPESVPSMFSRMIPQNLAIVSQLADSGNGEVQDASTDLPLVNGQDDPISTTSQTLHWDAEWHWDATYAQYPHQALGGHLVTLGLSSAQQLWQEYTYPILDWAHQHNGIAGFAHLQYLDGNGLPNYLTCCTPIEFPVEVALGASDFISEDVDDVNQTGAGNAMYSETPIQAYYKLLNSGFRPGLAAGTDYPCNAADNNGALGGLLTYAQVAGGQLTYRNWIQGIARGRTVVSRNGHNEFLSLNVNGGTPGDEIDLAVAGNVAVTIQWTAQQNWTGTIELVQNGAVVASKAASAGPGAPVTLTTTVNFAKSGWLAARRMGINPLTGDNEHYVHTAAVYVIVNNAPIRASQADAQYFVDWTNGLLQNTSAGGIWNSYFPTSLVQPQTRYQAAKALYQQIASEANGAGPALNSIQLAPNNQTILAGSQSSFNATGKYSDGSQLNLTGQVTWSSLDASIAAINPRGLVAAGNVGTTQIYAKLGAITSSTSVTVGNPVSIAITPVNPTLGLGNTQQFTAVATYADTSTQDVTGQAAWASSNPTVAGISAAGTATAMVAGTSTISATVGSIAGRTTLTVSLPLAITTTTLPGAQVNASYSGNLAASGGVPPYTWSISGGSALPAGISMSTSGQLSGAPTVVGANNFVVQVNDSVGAQASGTIGLMVYGGILPTDGPGGPILVISSATNPFSRYYVEILRAEGLNEFAALDISQVSANTLTGYDLVILGEFPLSSDQAAMLSSWVNAGGNLIAMRPDKQLAPILGLTDAGTVLANSYLLINTAGGPGAGLVGQTIQFHGTADLYTASAATTLATLYSDTTTATPSPAVTIAKSGAGQAAAFTYDLARSVVYTRQGNPAWSGEQRDGTTLIRSDNLFYGASTSDPEPDWVNLNQVAIPQADEQQRLLANLILQMDLKNKPLPRFWYLPRGLKAAVVMTGDDHGAMYGGGVSAQRFDEFLSLSPSGCSVADWQCVRSSAYLIAPVIAGNPLTNAQAASYIAQGFEVGVHMDSVPDCSDWTPSQLTSFYSSQISSFMSVYTSVPQPQSHRMHCVSWSDYDSQPQVELMNGIRFDANYYYWPGGNQGPDWIQDRPGMFTGSGMPMRFTKMDGTLIDVYQATTQMTDESGQSFPYNIDTLLDNAIGTTGYYGVFTANMHNDVQPSAGADAIVASAQARGIPIVSSLQMLQWIDGRNSSSFSNFAWNGNTLNFSITLGTNTNGAQAMLPLLASTGTLSGLTLNGTPVSFSSQSTKGIAYGVFPASSGAYAATYTADTTPPVISSISAAADTSATATVTWTTDELSTSAVEYGTAASSLNLQASASGMGTQHTVNLSGLTANTVYYFQVSSTDSFGNNAVAPSTPSSFQTPPASITDTSGSDFAAGTGSCSAVTLTSGGEVILTPSVDAEFTGSSLPAGWSTANWSSGGGVSYGGGAVTVDGAAIASNQSFASGISLDFVATFAGVPYQHAGFVSDPSFDPPWIMFSTGQTGTGLYARTSINGTNNDVLIPGNWLGTPHHFTINWTSTAIVFSIDNTPVSTQNVAIPNQLVLGASDFNAGGGSLSVNWMRVSPYASSCSFTSRVFDAGAPVFWSAMSWTANVPAQTSLTMSYRDGNTSTPDGSWTPYQPVTTSGTAIYGNSRYIQYSAALATANNTQTSALQSVAITYTNTPNLTPPVITAQSPAPGATNVQVGTSVSATFSNPMNAATISNSTFRLRAQGAASDMPAVVSYASGVATLIPSTNLVAATLYTVTVSGTVADLNGNQMGADASWTFTTSVVTLVHTDTTVVDFSGGSTAACSIVAHSGDGEVTLASAIGEEFSGVSIPTGWSSIPWTGGTVVVSNGLATVDGTLLAYNTYFSPGRSLEFTATFGADSFEHAGLGQAMQSTNESWAMFSTNTTTNALYARTDNAGTMVDTLIPGNWIGTPHRYRIDWTATSVVFSIDGAVVDTVPVAIAATMRPVISDYTKNGIAIKVDWLLMTPYSASCTFDSAVFDAGAAANWSALSWNATTPANTALPLSFRTGNSNNPSDGSWTSFTPVANSGSALTGTSRYIQYEAGLSTTDVTQTPVLDDVTISYSMALSVTATMTTPANGSSLSGSTVSFSWTPGSNSTDYWLELGSTLGGKQYYSQETTGTSLTVNNLPLDGSTVYATLYSLVGGVWQENHYTYTAYNFVKAVISSPASGAILAGRTVTFSWNNTGAAEYWLEVGNTAGGKQLYSASAGTGTSLTVNNLPVDGSPVYATLYTRSTTSPWQTTTASYTAAVVGMIATPANGSTLSGSTASFGWAPGTNATDYWLEIGSTLGGKQLYSNELGNVTTATVNNLPLDGSTLYVTLYSQMAGVWEKNQTSYKALNFAKATLSGAAPSNGSLLLGTTVTFNWNAGTGVSDYWLELGSTPGGKQYYSAPAAGGITSLLAKNLPVDGSPLYATLYSRPTGGAWQTDQATYTAASMAVILTPVNGSILPATSVTFNWTPGSGPTDYWLELGTTPGGKQLYSTETAGTSLTVNNLPNDGSSVYATLYCLISGVWQKNQYSYQTVPQ